MKKKLLFIMLALFSMMGSANAQGIEGNFSVSPDPVIIEAGGTAKVTLNLTNYSAFTGYEFRLVLPTGITLKKAVENEDAYPLVYNDDKEKWEITHSMQRELQSDGSYMFICISTKTTDPFVATKMITLTLEAASGAAGNLEATLTEIALSTTTGEGPTPSDVSFTISVKHDISLADDADNTSTIGSNDEHIVNATLAGYTLFKDGDWNTLCLPFSLDADAIAASDLAGAELMELDITDGYDYSDGNHVTGIAANGKLYLNFKTATSINAGTPYIIRWTGTSGEISSPIFSGVTIDNSATAIARKTVSFTGGQFIGLYAPVVYDDGAEHPEVLLLGSNNELFWPDGTNTSDVNSFHAYFLLESPIGNARSVALNLSDTETTGIKLIGDPQFACDNDAAVWYTIDGRKLSGKPTKKGMFINKGKKVVVK